jgi:glycosyltransferase involved in cell wall biosynthesis
MAGLDAASACVAVSPALADRMASFGILRPVVIPNLVDESIFYPEPARPGRFSFLTVCSITQAKGVDTLIRAIASWAPNPEEVEFRVVGEGAQLQEFHQLAEALGVADRIQWLGAVSRDTIPDLFRACHAFVLPSEFETFGMVYAEAVACGKPVIATRCGGPESILNEENGVLVNVGDTIQLAEAMRDLRDNYGRFDAGRIRADFMARFSRRAVTTRLAKLYYDLEAGVRPYPA